MHFVFAPQAGLAANTLFRVVEKFRARVLRFGVMAPLAAQRAAFQEDRGPDTRAVVHAKALDLAYDQFCFSVRFHFG